MKALPRLVSIKVAAEFLGIDRVTIRRHIRAGDWPAYRFGARAYRVDLDEIVALARLVTWPSTGARSPARSLATPRVKQA